MSLFRDTRTFVLFNVTENASISVAALRSGGHVKKYKIHGSVMKKYIIKYIGVSSKRFGDTNYSSGNCVPCANET